jgi:hypothetical protein
MNWKFTLVFSPANNICLSDGLSAISGQLETPLLKRPNALVKSTNAVYQAGQLAILAKRSPEIVVSIVQR